MKRVWSPHLTSETSEIDESMKDETKVEEKSNEEILEQMTQIDSQSDIASDSTTHRPHAVIR